jgi:hypothetical protein
MAPWPVEIQTTDGGPQTMDRRPWTADHGPPHATAVPQTGSRAPGQTRIAGDHPAWRTTPSSVAGKPRSLIGCSQLIQERGKMVQIVVRQIERFPQMVN